MWAFTKRVMASLLLLTCTWVAADSLMLGLSTIHPLSDYDYNEDNSLVGVELGPFHFATFDNSYNVRSYAIGGQTDLYTYKNLDFKLRYGVVKGYEKDNFSVPVPCSGDLCIYGAPEAVFNINKHIGIGAGLFGEAVFFPLVITW